MQSSSLRIAVLRAYTLNIGSRSSCGRFPFHAAEPGSPVTELGPR
jgi:hypothetical protein